MGKVTTIFVGGLMDERHWKKLAPASERYPRKTHFFTFTDNPPKVLEELKRGKRTAEKAFKLSEAIPSIFKDHKRGDILHFVQFGHGAEGPLLILQRTSLAAKDLVDLFVKNFSPNNRPVVAIILGGCYSGGFAEPFLQRFQPDFFFGASPPATVAFLGLFAFFAKSTADQNLDYNSDGIVTLRERAVYEMNEGNNPLAVMFSKSHSPDIDLYGNPAKKYYFQREVERVKDHATLIKTIEALRFGEQAVVLVPGGNWPELREKWLAWFKKEAGQGDGFYKFIIVDDDDSDNRQFFSTDRSPGLFAMGPNLRYHGVPLEPFKPIGDQIPAILAKEETLLILAGWKDKIVTIKSGRDIQLDYKRYLLKNPEFSMPGLLKSVEQLFQSKWDRDQKEALRLARAILDLDQAQREKLDGIVNGFVAKNLKTPHLDVLIELLNWSGLRTEHVVNLTALALNFKLYRKEFRDKIKNDVKEKRIVGACVSVIKKGNGDIDYIAKALRILGDLCSKEEDEDASLIISEYIKNRGLIDSNHPELRRASAFYLAQTFPYNCQHWLKTFIQQWRREDDPEVKTYLLRYLTKGVAKKFTCNEVFPQEARNLLQDEKTPENLKEVAQQYLATIRENQRN